MTTFPQYIPDHGDRLIEDDLYNKLRHLPRWASWATGIGGGAQLLEDQIFDLITGTYFDTCNGFLLERWGSYVGEERMGLNDTELRNFIRARMLVDVCGGNGDEYIWIYDLITSPNSGVRAVAKYPACFTLTTLRSTPMRDIVARRVVRTMLDAKADGIGMGLIEAVAPAFGFDGNPLASGFGVGALSRRLA